MIKSMTGFGRCEHVQGDRKFTVEIKAVNHRYFDVNIKMPKKFNFFESAIRSVMKEYIQRGKVDVFITCEDDTENNFSLKYNENIAGEYLKYYRQMAQQFNLKDDVTVSRLGSCPEVFSMEEQMVDEDEIWALLETALRGALKQFVETRTREGENLKNDLIGKLDGMLLDVDAVEKRYPQVLEEYRSRLREKVDSLLADSQMDESRLAAEVILYADKICTDEETVRLRSHIEGMKAELIQGGSIGRKLDFIAQEMNREANTIGSKCTDVQLARIVVEIKAELEKIREQTQNIV